MSTIQPAGNYYDKYRTRNPVARWLMNGFLDSFQDLLGQAGQPETALEVGCGEGELSIRVARVTGASINAFDIAEEVVTEARERALAAGVADRIRFRADSIYALDAVRDRADLVVCCEVLEHLESPAEAVDCLASVCGQHLLVSVPREPIWRAMNMARGKYLLDLGNTPGHVQHWSRAGFLALLQRRFDIVAVRSPMPWTMALCRPRSA